MRDATRKFIASRARRPHNFTQGFDVGGQLYALSENGKIYAYSKDFEVWVEAPHVEVSFKDAVEAQRVEEEALRQEREDIGS